MRIHYQMNLVFLDEFCSFGRERPDDIDPAELPALHDLLVGALQKRAMVAIDGVEVPPVVEGLRIAAADASLAPLFPRTGMRGMRRVEFDALYPVKRPPQSVTLDWTTYPPDILAKPGQPRTLAIVGELEGAGRREGFELTEKSPRASWRAPTASPVDDLAPVPSPESLSAAPSGLRASTAVLILAFSGALIAHGRSMRVAGTQRRVLRWTALLFLAGAVGAGVVRLREGPAAAGPTAEQARAVFEPLHANLYRALDYTKEATVYDVLARSVDGPLLERLYRELRRSLAIEEAGGAMGRVAAVRPLSVEVESTAPRDFGGASVPAFTVLARWQVDGTVAHWGHRHARTNEYLARYIVAATPAGWRIVSQELLEERRLDDPAAQPQPPDGGNPIEGVL